MIVSKAGATSHRWTEANANVNAIDKQHRTPLLEAVRAGKLENVKLLLRRGATLSLADGSARHVILIATKYGQLHCGAELVSYLAQEQIRDSELWTPLHYAVASGDLAAVERVLDGVSGRSLMALVHTAGIAGVTPMHMAAVLGNTHIISVLAEYGCSLDAVTEEGESPLHWACRSGHADVCALLLLKGAPVAPVNIFGYNGALW